MLCIQAPGTALFVIFQGAIDKSSLTTWLPFLFSCAQQLILLIICVVFWWRDRRTALRVTRMKKNLDTTEHSDSDEERIPLVHDV